jgi:hypothetical protein
MAEGKVTVNNIELQDDLLTLQSYAFWLNNRGIKSLSFSADLTRKELINFHKVISAKILREEELSRAFSEQNIRNISLQCMAMRATDYPLKAPLEERPPGVLCEGYVSTMHQYEDDAEQHHMSFITDLSTRRLLQERDQKAQPFEGYMSHRYDNHWDLDQEKDSFVADLSIKSVSEEKSRQGPIEGYLSTMHEMEGSGDETSAINDLPLRLIKGEFSERDEQVRAVEMLCEQEITDNERSVIRSIPPDHMAHILNAILCGPPREDVVRRVAAAYFSVSRSEKAEDSYARQRIFFEELDPELKHNFWMSFVSLISNNNSHYSSRRSGEICYASATDDFSIDGTWTEKTDVASPAPEVFSQTLGGSDFIFDFVVGETGVLHDLEFNAEVAALLDGKQFSQLQEVFVRDEVCLRPGNNDMKSGSVAMLIEDCSDEMLLAPSFDVMIELIESGVLESDVFMKMLGKLTSLTEKFLEKGEFGKALELYNSLRTLSLQEKNSMHALSMIRGIFSTDSFNSNAVEALKRYGRKQRESAGKFMLALRSFIVPYLLDALNEENDPSKRRFMISLLASVRGDVLPFIISRLRDARWYVVRNMLYLLRECHGRSYLKEIKDFLGHKVPLVQLEALRTLLSFQDPEADLYVRTFLKSGDFELQKGAVRLAGAYRVRNAVPQLLLLLKEKDMLGKKFLFKKRIIRMLGRIGDGRAVGQLLKICRSSSMVHKNDLERLKVEIFKTFHYYPLATIGPILDYGLQSSSKEIIAICNKIIKRYKLPDEREDL